MSHMYVSDIKIGQRSKQMILPPQRSAVIIQPPFLTDFFLFLLVMKRLESYVAVQHTHTHTLLQDAVVWIQNQT